MIIKNNNNINNIYFYNTLSQKKEIFKPIKKDEVTIYTCGPTVYHYAHIGNLRAYIFADILNNILKEYGYKVKHQINITDVGHTVTDNDDGEDKMEKGAKREGKNVWEIAEFYTNAFFNDLKELNINKEKFIWTKATDYIKEQIDMIKILEERNYTYKTKDGIYFDTSKFKKYTELSKLDLTKNDKNKTGRKIIGEENKEKNEKRNDSDFCLWKFKNESENIGMKWESPWGIGVPGWHIECSAMSRAILGQHIDIHTGGIDHIPIHHTNEIAQSECSMEYSCDINNNEEKKFVNYWMHVNFLNSDKEKMSKSLNNFLRLESLKEKNISPLAFKYLLLMTHYRKELKFSFESLNAANNAYEKLLKKIESIKNNLNESEKDLENKNIKIFTNEILMNKFLNDFISAMHNDINTSIALSILWSVINDKILKNEEKYFLIKKMDKYFALNL